MKKTLFVLPGLIFSILVNAQKLEADKVPDAVKTSFTKQYPGVKATRWELEDGQYEASYKKNGISMSSNFKPDGAFTESETTITMSDLPTPTKEYLSANYKGIKIRETSRITKATGAINYEASISGKDVIFDAAGKFIKVSKD